MVIGKSQLTRMVLDEELAVFAIEVRFDTLPRRQDKSVTIHKCVLTAYLTSVRSCCSNILLPVLDTKYHRLMSSHAHALCKQRNFNPRAAAVNSEDSNRLSLV